MKTNKWIINNINIGTGPVVGFSNVHSMTASPESPTFNDTHKIVTWSYYYNLLGEPVPDSKEPSECINNDKLGYQLVTGKYIAVTNKLKIGTTAFPNRGKILLARTDIGLTSSSGFSAIPGKADTYIYFKNTSSYATKVYISFTCRYVTMRVHYIDQEGSDHTQFTLNSGSTKSIAYIEQGKYLDGTVTVVMKQTSKITQSDIDSGLKKTLNINTTNLSNITIACNASTITIE